MQHIHTSYARDAAHAHTHFSYCEFFHRMRTPADPPHYGENGLNRRSEPLFLHGAQFTWKIAQQRLPRERIPRPVILLCFNHSSQLGPRLHGVGRPLSNNPALCICMLHIGACSGGAANPSPPNSQSQHLGNALLSSWLGISKGNFLSTHNAVADPWQAVWRTMCVPPEGGPPLKLQLSAWIMHLERLPLLPVREAAQEEEER